MQREIDPRVRQFGEYLEERIAEQGKRPYSEREDIERMLGVYDVARRIYREIFQLDDSKRTNEIYKTLIREMDLSVRTRAVLQKSGETNLGELVEKTEGDLRAMKNFGQTSLAEIKALLNEKGLFLKADS